jgi:hypothetical protein
MFDFITKRQDVKQGDHLKKYFDGVKYLPIFANIFATKKCFSKNFTNIFVFPTSLGENMCKMGANARDHLANMEMYRQSREIKIFAKTKFGIFAKMKKAFIFVSILKYKPFTSA